MSNDDSDTVVETIVRAEVIQTAIDQLTTIVGESVLEFSSDGIYTSAIDPANVALAEVDIGAGALESVPDGSFVAGADLNSLDDYLSGASGDDLVSFAFDPESRRLTLKHTNRTFKMSMIDPDMVRDSSDIPEMELTSTVFLPSGVFSDALDTAALIQSRDGQVTLVSNADGGTFEVLAEGDIDEARVTLDDELGDGTQLGNFETIYSLPYLNGGSGIVSGIPSGVDLRIRYGEELPMKMDYEFADGHAEALLMLAPRINSS